MLHTHDEEVGPHILNENPAVETIKCIAARLGRSVEIRRAPRRRNAELMAAGRIDGMFPNMPDADLNEIAVPSEPFVLERWSFVQRRESVNPARPRNHLIGTVLGSNESHYLRNEKANVFDAIPNMQSLIRLVAADRVPYAMADDWSFYAQASALGYASERFRSAIVRYVPLQAYFSKPFMRANPGFLSRFNERIRDCVHAGRRVAKWEREILIMEVDKILAGPRAAILEHLKRHRALGDLDPMLSRMEALSGADDAWRKALGDDRMNTLMEVILSNPLSDLLREAAAAHPLVTEIFVTNEDGFIIGLNRLTSDYWQGDESAAGAILSGNTERLADRHFSAFEYDLSTSRFQVKVSVPLLDPDGEGGPIGMITVGIDAARALAGNMH